MIVVDTSVWIDHFRRAEPRLVTALNDEEVLVHPFVAGELACSSLRNRREILQNLSRLPGAPTATHEEVLAFVEHRSLAGRGIGYVDVHLLASTVLNGTARLWTHDKRLAGVAEKLGMLYR